MVRPHVKIHKPIYMTRMQMAAGAKGIAVAKAGEALFLAENLSTDIYLGHLYGDAVRVVDTVISDRVDSQVVINVGSKALSIKQLLAGKNLKMGYVREYPEARIFRRHEEHGGVVSKDRKMEARP